MTWHVCWPTSLVRIRGTRSLRSPPERNGCSSGRRLVRKAQLRGWSLVDTATPPVHDGDFALAGLSLNTALPDITIATSASQTQLTWIVDSYTLILACLLLPAGALVDRYGRRGAMLVGLVIFTAASLVPAVLSDPMIVIVSRGVVGAGAALIMSATLSLITAAHPKDQRNKAVGIWAGVAGSGAVTGMLGSVGLLNFWSWHSIFWAFAGAALTIFILTFTIASSSDPEAHPLDGRGASRSAPSWSDCGHWAATINSCARYVSSWRGAGLSRLTGQNVKRRGLLGSG